MESVAECVGVSVRRLRRDRRAGLVDPTDLRSLARYILGLAPIPAAARDAYLRLGIALGIDAAPGRSAGPEGIPCAPTVPTGSRVGVAEVGRDG